MTDRDDALRWIDRAVRAGDIPRAAALAEEALGQGIEHPGVLNLAAHAALERGDFGRTIALLERARGLAPRDVHVLNSLGIAYKRVGRFADAIEAFDAAIAAAPTLANGHYNKGTAFEAQDDLESARAAYEQAIAREPNFADALGRLSFLAAMRGEYDEACVFAERAVGGRPNELPAALKVAEFAQRRGDHTAAAMLAGRVVERMPDYLPAVLSLAKAEVSAGTHDSARTHLNLLLARPALGDSHALALNLLARIEEESGNYPAAFAAYTEAKAKLDRAYAGQHGTPTGTAYGDRVAYLVRYFGAAPAQQWAAVPDNAKPVPNGPTRHVFMVGFIRSGTTLLERTLAQHPGIATMEEEESLIRATTDFVGEEGGLDRLAVAPSEILDRYREHYWRASRGAVPTLGGKVFVDKMPFYSLYIPLIAKLFPTAKIIFSLRDPRDVVLSCLKQPFTMNAAMYEVANLERAARLYDSVMQLREIYRERVGLAWLDSRYEDLVTDFTGEIGRVLDFLGVAWNDAIRDVATSRQARVSTTPSGAQVARGLYDGSGQWRRYKTEMAPVLPILAPWVEKFGYPKD